jgi:hypothetical protein
MKYVMNSLAGSFQFAQNPNERTKCTSLNFALLVLAAALLLTASPAQAANVLANPGFEQNSGPFIPSGWARFAPPTAQHGGSPNTNGNFYIEGVVSNQSGLLHFKEWGACYNTTNNAAGLYQDLSSGPGSTYQASGWFFINPKDVMDPDCYVWIDVQFLGSSSNLLALYKSDNFGASVGTGGWFQYQVDNACNISSPVSIGDPFFNTYAVTGSVSQLVAPAGTTKIRYRFVYVQVASEGGSCYFDSAALDQIAGPAPPVISSLFPLNMIFVNASDGITFNASSPRGYTINNNGIGLVVNGVDVSGGLTISGSSSNKSVAYYGLQSNSVYTASISVTDASNLTASASTYFETTWVGVPPVVYVWEAEDFDFTNGLYYNFPTLCTNSGTPNCYFDKVGVEGVDEHSVGTTPNHVYRPADAVGTLISGDYARKDHYLAGAFDYRIDPFNTGDTNMWLNYTRDWSNGTYWVVGRLSSDVGLTGKLSLSNSTTATDLGTFTLNGGLGWGTFLNVYLKDTNGNNALVTLNGKQTLRLTTGGNLLPNFFMLVAASADLPQLSNVYPTGTHPFEYTNAFSFTVSAFGSSFPANGIRLNVDGNDVSSNLVITGSTSTKNVVFPELLPNAIHVAIITVTNSLGHGILVTSSFDTFSEANYMVEAEDFDYGGGQYISASDWFPDAYADINGPFPATTNVDFQHITLANEVFVYRAVGIPQDFLSQHDWLRSNFVYYGAQDLVLVFFAPTDWANYTREYPAGSFYVYIRSSGDGPFSMYLDQVVSGAGTVNQVTKRLGHFGGFGRSPVYNTYDWVPLTDDGLAAPAVVTLNGVTTLRLTTAGNCNPNYFMLVPASGITLSAARSGSNVSISFPTQAGAAYRVFYRTNLNTGNWILLTTVLGDGTAKSVSDPMAGSQRFYKVTSP